MRPFCWMGIVWSLIIIGYMTLPRANNIAGEYTIYFELVGVLWFFLYLGRRLRAGLAGPPAADHMEPAHTPTPPTSR